MQTNSKKYQDMSTSASASVYDAHWMMQAAEKKAARELVIEVENRRNFKGPQVQSDDIFYGIPRAIDGDDRI